MNANLLKGKIAENGLTIGKLAEAIGIKREKLSLRLSGKICFSVKDIKKIKTTLNLTPEDVDKIFLSE